MPLVTWCEQRLHQRKADRREEEAIARFRPQSEMQAAVFEAERRAMAQARLEDALAHGDSAVGA